MSQEYTEDKEVSLQPLSSGRRLLEALLIIVALFAVYLMAALMSFNPSDPSWSQTAWHEPIHNLGGGVGAWIADTLFFIFGVMAYALPPVILGPCWIAFRQRHSQDYIDYFAVALRLIGVLALVVTSCGLAALNADDIWYFASGGVIGSLLSNAMAAYFSDPGGMLTLLCIWAAGLTLYTGWSWLTIAEKIGGVVMVVLTFASNCSRADERWHEEDDEEYQADERPARESTAPLMKRCVQADDADDVLLAKLQPIYADDEDQEQYDLLLAKPVTAASEVAAAQPAAPQFSAAPVEPAQPPLYRFEVPAAAETPAPFVPVQLVEDNDGPQMGNWRDTVTSSPFDFSMPHASHPAPVAAAQSATSNTPFMPDFTATSGDDLNPQVKQGIGPELPRPNPVKLPTRRELASYGIKLPSQRMAEEKAKQQEQSHAQPEAFYHAECNDEQDAAEQAQLRYDEEFAAEDEEALLLAALTLKFANQQQQRYAAEPQLIAAEAPKPQEPDMDGLIHPFLMRHEQPTYKPKTPLPTLDLLSSPPAETEQVDQFALEQTARLIEARLADYRIKAVVVGYSPGPVIIRFELDLAPGVKAARISNLSRDLARSLSAVAVRVVEVIPGRPYVGLELPNLHRQTVYLREVLDCPAFHDNPSPLSIVLGKDISGNPVVADLGKMPHLLVAGTTGSGKSVGVNAMILSILYKATPKEVRFIMIDPKMLELSVYEGIPHLLTDVVTDMKDAANALRWCVVEMERRYKLMSALGVRNIAGYNEKVDMADAMGRPVPDPFWKPTDSMDMTPPVLEKEPYIVVMVDEFADLIMAVGKKVEELIARLAQKARAAGIHLVLATQRPSVDVITGLIKANIPTRIAFTVSSKIDSRTILDQCGAESLLGMGDMLYLAPNSSIPVRVHGAFVRDQEVHAVVADWKAREHPQYKEGTLSGGEDSEASGGIDGDEELDQLFDQAVQFVVDKRRASISGVQRQFRIGYNRAARIIEQMEAQGIVSSPGHNGNRKVLAQPPPEM